MTPPTAQIVIRLTPEGLFNVESNVTSTLERLGLLTNTLVMTVNANNRPIPKPEGRPPENTPQPVQSSVPKSFQPRTVA